MENIYGILVYLCFKIKQCWNVLKFIIWLLRAKGRNMFICRQYLVCLLLLILSLSVKNLCAREESIPSILRTDSALYNDAEVEGSKRKSNSLYKTASYAVVIASALNLRSSPNTKIPPLKVLPKGKHLLILSALDKIWRRRRSLMGLFWWLFWFYGKFAGFCIHYGCSEAI